MLNVNNLTVNADRLVLVLNLIETIDRTSLLKSVIFREFDSQSDINNFIDNLSYLS
jgi:hypothetical protein